MKIFSSALLTVGLSVFAISCQAESQIANKQNLETDKDKISYLVGRDMGKQLNGIKAEIDMAVVFQAVQEEIAGAEGKIKEEDAMKIRQEFSKRMQAKFQAEQKAKSEKGKSQGAAFLEKNKTAKGIKVTASGLQYKVIKEGTGESPKETDKVKVHYVGTTLDGKEFDSSVKRGKPVTFPLKGVIKGWTEGVQLMKVGGKYEFFIPAELAYGERGAGAKIGPNSALKFEIELLEIVKEDAAKAVAPAPAPAKK
jgi:FKBP-type peptidyl-prolyl cis-trans isomerase FkpA/FKBP-type peptidyl-prolyl cis-trans isomerase FklB